VRFWLRIKRQVLFRAATHAAAKLVKLREAEALRPSTTISVALGTSTPTSITVVATSTQARRRETAHDRVLSPALHAAVDQPTCPRRKRMRRIRARSSAAAASLFSLSSTSGQTQ
jgi:hypothetical protein